MTARLVILGCALGTASAFTTTPSSLTGRKLGLAPSLVRTPARAGLPLSPSRGNGAARLTAVAEHADAINHMAFLLSTHVDADTISKLDVSHLTTEVNNAFMHLADAAVAAKDAAAAAPGADAAAEAVPKEKGWFDTLVLGVQTCLVTIHDVYKKAGVPGAWGCAIGTFTIFVKAITYPLNYKQMASTMSMQALQPKLKAIQARYKDDPQRMNEMTAQLYKDEEVNPLAGCIPAIIQLPIFISLYRALLELAQEDKLEESFLWVPSLQGPVGEYNPVTNLPVDSLGWLTKGWIDGHPAMGWEATAAYLSLPIILVVTQSLSMKILQPPPSDDPAQQQTQAILKFLPLMIGWFALNVPAGLGVYWVINNGLSTFQQWFIREQFKDKMPAAAGAGGGDMGTSMPLEYQVAPKQKMVEPPKAFTPTKKAAEDKPKVVEVVATPVVTKDAGETVASGEESSSSEGAPSKSAKKKKAKARGKKKK